jgi:hypothetical protein
LTKPRIQPDRESFSSRQNIVRRTTISMSFNAGSAFENRRDTRDADKAQDAMQFEYKRVIEVSLDPQTMIPAWAKDVMNASFRGREPELIEDVQRVESKEWTFELVQG